MHRTARAGGRNEAEFDLPKIVLEITRGRAQHKSREVRTAAFLIGTAADCDLVLGDPRFDAVHSYLIVSRQRVTIRQLGQGPPLCVGGRIVPWASLEDFDRLQLGPYEFQVRIQWPCGNSDAGRSGAAQADALRPPVDHDGAIERLLRDVEQAAPVPRLSLYVEDSPEDPVEGAPGRMSVKQPTWRQPRKKAGF